MNSSFEKTLAFARQKDATDPLRRFRKEFYFPLQNGQEQIYFCGNSLGLLSKRAEQALLEEISNWKEFAISGFSKAKDPWLYYHTFFTKALSKIAGCLEQELAVMNTLSVNIHLAFLTFYHPTNERYKILMEAGAFPSDQYALETQVKFHGFNPQDAIIEVAPREGERLIREEDIIEQIERNKEGLAIVWLGCTQYYSGQLFDIELVTEAAHKASALAGFDLAHAIGNVPVRLHDWNVDFATWCSYKYLNGGPGCVGGMYLHEKYARDIDKIRMAGWWGNDEKTRFKMEKGFIAKPDAGGWNISTVQVMNMAALKASLEMFEEAGMDNLRKKSVELTGFLEFLLGQLTGLSFEIITPEDPHRRGAQLSLFFNEKGKEVYDKMLEAGIVVDYREPGVIRVAPVPIYNSFEDVFRFYEILENNF